MRCKNCGTYNDDNRYICETCGSPLYDDESMETNEISNSGNTQSFSPVSNTPTQMNDIPQPNSTPVNAENEKPSAEKKNIIVIAILAVVLIAVIASVAVIAHSKSKNEETTIPSTSQTTTQPSSKPTHSTSKSTTESTTEKTTTTTTTTAPETTQAEIWYINTNSSGGGKVKGSGEYKNGDKVTITATPDSDYVFDGWYSEGVKVSTSEKYTFIANGNLNFTAVFNPKQTENPTVENDDENDINFGA